MPDLVGNPEDWFSRDEAHIESINGTNKGILLLIFLCNTKTDMPVLSPSSPRDFHCQFGLLKYE